MVVCVVTDQTVGDRRFPRAATLWGEFLSLPPTIDFASRRQVLNFLIDLFQSCAS